MNTHADKAKKYKSRAVANVASQKTRDNSTFQFVDKRPHVVAQRKLEEIADNSPQIKQLKSFQEKVNKNNSVIQAMFGRPTQNPIPERLEYSSSSMATTSAMVLFTGTLTLIEERTFGSGRGSHAEEKVIQYLQSKVDDGTLTPQGATTKDYILHLSISKSPCSSTSEPATRTDGHLGCLERLIDLNVHGLTSPTGVNVTFDVQLAATKPYSPHIVDAKDASRRSYGDFGGGEDGGGTFGFGRK